MSLWYFEYNPYVRKWLAHDHKYSIRSSVLCSLQEEIALTLIETNKSEKVRQVWDSAIFPDSTHNGDDRYCYEWQSSEIPENALQPFGKETK